MADHIRIVLVFSNFMVKELKLFRHIFITTLIQQIDTERELSSNPQSIN